MKRTILPAGDTHAILNYEERDHIGRIIDRGTWYEKDLLDDARSHYFGPEAVAIDVGAHIGNHSIWFALAMRLNVIALEPNPSSFEILKQNLEANNLALPEPYRPFVRAMPVAAGDRPGWGRVQPPAIEHNSGTVSVAREDDEGQQDAGQVPITTLDELLVFGHIELIKIDVEGAAAEVLAGAKRILAENNPVIYAEGDRDEIAAALPAGYECFGQFAKTPTFGFSR